MNGNNGRYVARQVFAARVNLPAIAMPERSYLRLSLAEMADEIQQELSEAFASAPARRISQAASARLRKLTRRYWFLPLH